GGLDAARLVALACHPGREFGAALTAEDQVGVGVDETGQHRPAATVDHLVGGRRPRGGPQPRNPAVLNHQRRVRDRGEGPWPGWPPAIAGGRVGYQLADVRDQRAHGPTLTPGTAWTEALRRDPATNVGRQARRRRPGPEQP